MEQKIRIKLGSIEIEFEGDQDYLKNDLPNLIDKIIELNSHIPKENLIKELLNNDSKESSNEEKSEVLPQLSANTICAKISAKSASDIALAACAHLTLIQNKSSFKRSEILDEMKNASNYFNTNSSKNLTQSLKSLVSSGKLIERSTDTYALSAKEKESLKTRIIGD